jgi:hypothetical protein
MACTANTPLEKALEADILTLRKRGHFYFALTRIGAVTCAKLVINEGTTRCASILYCDRTRYLIPGRCTSHSVRYACRIVMATTAA